MAEADLDFIIRRIAKQQHKSLLAATKGRRAHFLKLAGKAKDKDAEERYKHLAKNAMELGSAAANRLHVSADNVADRYARAMRKASEDFVATPPAAKEAKDGAKKVAKTNGKGDTAKTKNGVKKAAKKTARKAKA